MVGVRKELLDIVCCPRCQGSLGLVDAVTKDNQVVSGSLVCGVCSARYPISDGLPILMHDVNMMSRTATSFGKQWEWQDKLLFETDTIYGLSEEEELRDFENGLNVDLQSVAGRRILDAGCGVGRLTRNIGKAAEGATVVGIDVSGSARTAYNLSKEIGNVHIVQGNLLAPPFRFGTFHYIWSEGVIHHTPDSFETFKTLHRLLASGGRLYVWVYPNYKFSPFRLARDLLWKPYLLPFRAIYALSWLFAVPVFCAARIRRLLGGGRKIHTLRYIAFGFFDNLSPQFQHRHSKEDVLGWFASCGYREIKLSSDLGVSGRKTDEDPVRGSR